MYKGIPYSNKIIKRRQQERVQIIHKQNLRNIRPLTTNIDFPFEVAAVPPVINNKKKDMLQQDRFTQIERQNRMLLQKINTIMSKKPEFKIQKIKRNHSVNNDKKERMNKSLNEVYRKKQLEGIEIQNAKLLKRLQEKKSDYEAKRLKQEWKKQKSVIKNIANYPFIIRDRIPKGRRKSMTSQSFHQGGFVFSNTQNNQFSSSIQLVRIRNLNGQNFLINVKYNGETLQILGDNKSTKQIKVIEVPKEEALQFIHFQCEGKIQKLFDCLKYDSEAKILYLVGKDVELDEKRYNQANQQQDADKKNDSIEKADFSQQLQPQKNAKKRQMSNINEVEESEMYTQPAKITENNFHALSVQTEEKQKINIQSQKKHSLTNNDCNQHADEIVSKIGNISPAQNDSLVHQQQKNLKLAQTSQDIKRIQNKKQNIEPNEHSEVQAQSRRQNSVNLAEKVEIHQQNEIIKAPGQSDLTQVIQNTEIIAKV